MEDQIRRYALAQGATIAGFANDADFSDAPAGFKPTDIMPKAKGVIVLGKAIPAGVVSSGNSVVYTAHHLNTMKQLDTLAHAVALFIEESGGLALPVPADDPYFHWENERKHGMGILSHRHAAVKAGLGQLGKNSLLITPKYGNRVELVSVLTDIEFKTPPQTVDLCPATCRLCVDVCKSGALSGNYSIEQKPCRSYAPTKSDRGHTLYKCWECRAVCPVK
jgi:epoxyqueuosine reductase QueG